MRYSVIILFISLVPVGRISYAEGGGSNMRLKNQGKVAEFRLTERSGKTLGREELLGSVWIANFIFTRCSGQCPILSMEMASLQRKLPKWVRLVSFTVDPEYDTPEVLIEYAETYRAGDRWWFFTGDRDAIYTLIHNNFQVNAEESGEVDPGRAFSHSLRFMLVDQHGTIRGAYSGDKKNPREHLKHLEEDVYTLLGRWPPILPLYFFPPLNAALNGTALLLLLTGFMFIRKKKVNPHKACMVAAFLVSILFLICYLYYHWYHGATPFRGQGIIRTIYLSILISHIILAALVPILASITLWRAAKEQFEKHRRIAHWTLPIWLYVSVTGVVIYYLLYHVSERL